MKMDTFYHISGDKWWCSEHRTTFTGSCPVCDLKLKSKSEVLSKSSEQFRTIPKGPRKISEREHIGIRKSILERFHAYRMRFEAVVDWDSIPGPIITLRSNVRFKRIDLPTAIIRVFKASILVTLRASCEIKGLKVKEAKAKADEFVLEALKGLPEAIRVSDPKLVSMHNAFVNHPTASHKVNVVVDGQSRLISDMSTGVPEFEAVHPQFAVSDSEVLEAFNADLILNQHDQPSILTKKINLVVDVLDKYAMQMDLHLAVEGRTADNMDKMNILLDDLLGAVRALKDVYTRKEQNEKNSPLLMNLDNNSVSVPENVSRDVSPPIILPMHDGCFSLLTISKYDNIKTFKRMKARYYLDKYGW